MRFTWDAKKAEANLRKHAVSFEEAMTVFADPLALFIEDAAHDERMLLIGQSAAGRVLLTVFTEVDDETTRIISARRVTAHERRRYEEADA